MSEDIPDELDEESSGDRPDPGELTVYAVQKAATEPLRAGGWTHRFSLQTRIILFGALLIVVPFAVTAILVEKRWSGALRAEVEHKGIATARILAAFSKAGLSSSDGSRLLEAAQTVRADPGVLFVMILDSSGKQVVWAAPTSAPPPGMIDVPAGAGASGSEPLPIEMEYRETETAPPQRVLCVTVPVLEPGPGGGARLGTVRVGYSLQSVRDATRKARLAELVIAEIAVALAVLGGLLLARQVTTPIRNLVAATIRAAKGDLHTRIKIQSAGEIGELARNFNFMVEQVLQNQKKIEELNRNLEKKVKTRTLELENSNQALKRAFQELKQAESQMILSEKMASLGQLVAGVAHEINTPTSAINAAADNIRQSVAGIGEQMQVIAQLQLEPEAETRLHDLLRKTTKLVSEGKKASLETLRQKCRDLEDLFEDAGVGEQRELAFALARLDLAEDTAGLVAVLPPSVIPAVVPILNDVATTSTCVMDIHYSVEAIMRMVKALKAYSHLDLSEMTEVNVHDGIETTLIILQNQLKYGVEIERDYGEVPATRGNPSELNQIWTNILLNAIQAQRGKGRIAIETSYAKGWISVKFTDNGPGIPPNILGRIFDPFFTTKEQGEGTGLGLSICQQLVRRNRGKINVSSRPGHTCFEVLLPVADGERA